MATGASGQQAAAAPGAAADDDGGSGAAAVQGVPVPERPVRVKADTRTQYPAFMRNSYFSMNIGSIRYLFNGQQLEPGFEAESVEIPHLAARVDLFGHHFTKYLALQATYLRPVRYVVYQNINGNQSSGQVAEAYGGVTLVSEFPLSRRVSGYGEGGWGVTSRSGLTVNGAVVVRDAHFAAGLLGAGLEYHATPNMDLLFGATYSPGRKSFDQPSTRLFTTGIRYQMRPLPAAEVDANREAGFSFPANVIRLGYTTNLLAYGVNSLFTQALPIFWGGKVETRRGFTLDYQRNVFHTRKWFAFDLGASASYWKSNGDKELFRTLSVYPLLRFMLVRARSADFYGTYSVAGPTFLSQPVIDREDTGTRFTFQDALAVGAFLGQARRLNVEIGIKHYSNGNIFTRNAAIKIPLTLTLGMTF